jgi:methionyl-tRNA formyltransferase
MSAANHRVDEGPSLRVVLFAADGRYQRNLAFLLAQRFDLAGIVWQRAETPKGPLISRLQRYVNPRALAQYVAARLANARDAADARPLLDSLFGTEQAWDAIHHEIPSLTVTNINDPRAVDFVRNIAPKVVCVNGTNLLREPMLALAPSIHHGFINLHTGLSPYSRGGNCDLFMLLEGHPEWVGITIHHIDSGIDSGDIIITARPGLAAGDNYEMIEAKSFRLGNDMMVVALKQLAEARAQRVRQWTDGKLFLRRTGYVYRPYHRLLVNRALRKGLIAQYLSDRERRDRGVRLVGEQA